MIECDHDFDSWSFILKQGDGPRFVVPEGYMQRITEVFLKPEDFDFPHYLWSNFKVTEEAQCLILTVSSAGKSKLLIKLSKTDAKTWAEQIEAAHGSVIHSYSC